MRKKMDTKKKVEFLEINGSVGAGGGQIVRLALSLSCILQRPVRITHIRENRPKPGLGPNHLACLKLLQRITRAQVEGDYLGAATVEFTPFRIRYGKYTVDSKNAGSVTLLLQAALPVLLFAERPSELDLRGETHTSMAPTVDYIIHNFSRHVKWFGAEFKSETLFKGYHPKGGGHAVFKIQPVRKLKSTKVLHMGKDIFVYGYSTISGKLPMVIAQEMRDGAREVLKDKVIHFDLDVYKEFTTLSRGVSSVIYLVVGTSTEVHFGATGVGEKGVPPRETGRKTAEEILSCIKTKQCLDQHAQDQLLIYMALAEGRTKIRIGKATELTTTSMWVISMFLGTICEVRVRDTENYDYICEENYDLICDGIGLENTHPIIIEF